MADRKEAMELRISATVEGDSNLSSRELEDRIEDMLRRIARETGIKLSDVHVGHVGEDVPGFVESEVDWLSD